MANVNLARGGTPDFKGFFCEGQYAEFTPPYDAPPTDGNPPFDSHADAAYGQGYLNLHFPLVPNLADTTAHRWMQAPLQKLSAVGDVIYTNWVPHRSFLTAYYIEVKEFDPQLTGVYVKPVAHRVAWNFTTQQWTYTPITAFSDEITAAGITQIPLGTPATGDKIYGIARLSMDPTVIPSTFGHNLVVRNEVGEAVGPYDARYGTVMLGLQISAGDAAKIKLIWRSDLALYTTSKLLAFAGAAQVG